eukprot:1560230-Karenia_brevis.AAC.1
MDLTSDYDSDANGTNIRGGVSLYSFQQQSAVHHRECFTGPERDLNHRVLQLRGGGHEENSIVTMGQDGDTHEFVVISINARGLINDDRIPELLTELSGVQWDV